MYRVQEVVPYFSLDQKIVGNPDRFQAFFLPIACKTDTIICTYGQEPPFPSKGQMLCPQAGFGLADRPVCGPIGENGPGMS